MAQGARAKLRLIEGGGEPAAVSKDSEPSRSRVNLGTMAVLQGLAESGNIPRHRNYLLTSYDASGYFIPHKMNTRDAQWNEAFAVAESLRASLFPKSDAQENEDQGLDPDKLEAWAGSFAGTAALPTNVDQFRQITDTLLVEYPLPRF